jgi:hypothetical protein
MHALPLVWTPMRSDIANAHGRSHERALSFRASMAAVPWSHILVVSHSSGDCLRCANTHQCSKINGHSAEVSCSRSTIEEPVLKE